MIVHLTHNNQTYQANLQAPLDISIPLGNTANNVTAWYVDAPKIEPVVGDNFIGSVKEGSSVNFRNISFNPHGHGTHTECVGHINTEVSSVNQALNNFHFVALVLSIEPETWKKNSGTREIGDKIILLAQVKEAVDTYKPQALIIRTIPNNEEKLHQHYSNTNPAYVCHEVMDYITKNGVEHFLIDLPSVDKEVDKGQLLAHKAFWNYPKDPFYSKTITEFIYVPNTTADGLYLLNLQVAPFENDASPSRPVLFALIQ